MACAYIGCWQWDGEGLDLCCWPDIVVLSYSWSSSIQSLTPEAWIVCCWGLRLLLCTMSEHMQLSLALCRIGLYTVRKRVNASLCLLENGRDVLYCVCVCVLDWIVFVSPWFNLTLLCFETDTDQVTAAAASVLLGHWMERARSRGCSHNIKVEQVDVSTVRCKLNLQRKSFCLWVKAVCLRIETKIVPFFLQLLAIGLVSCCSLSSLK